MYGTLTCKADGIVHYCLRVHYVSPEGLGMPADVLANLVDMGIFQMECRELTDKVLRETDVFYRQECK